MPLTDDITAKLLTIKALQTQYENTIKAYGIAKDNYGDTLTINTLNPCKSYSLTSTSISQACANKIWSDQKCTTTAPTVVSTSTFNELLTNAFTKSKSSVTADKTLCYGTAANPVLNTSLTAVSSAHNSDFIAIPSSTWTGATATVITTVTTAATRDLCIQTCAANVACTGSTYTAAATNNCSSVIGSGILTATPLVSTNIALIPQLTNNLLTLNTLNTTLMGIIDSIEQELLILQPNLDAESAQLLDTSLFETGFRADYATLIADRTKIADLLKNYDDLSTEYDEKSLFANRENNSLRIWTIAAVIMFIFLIKYAFGLDSPAINTIFWLTVIVLLGLTLSNPTGFIGLGILILLFLSFIIN
jgi:hypothetical protein